MRWYLAHDPGPLPHLFRVLWLFWSQRDLEREARAWVEQLLPAAGTLDPQPRAELAWVAAVTAVDTGDDAAALAARQRLAPLLAGIQDPFLHAASQLAMAWTLPIPGDFDGALREAAVSLEEFRGQGEPVFTAMAAFTAGSVETALGRYDSALHHLRESRELAERAGGDWLAAGSRVQLGILAVLQGRLDEARALLEQALDLSLAARSTQFVALCLAGYACLAFADGDLERAARLEGAAEGLRRRVGLPAWPHLRKVEAELVAQVRQRLGAGQFDQAFSAGSRLTQRQAVAIVQDQHLLPGLAGNRPGVHGQPGICALKVVVEHDGERPLPVVTPAGGGERGALPGGTGLAAGRPGGDHFEQPVRLRRGHAGLNQSLPCRRDQLGHEFGGGKRADLVWVPGRPGEPGGQALLGGAVEAVVGTLERQRVGPLLVLSSQP